MPRFIRFFLTPLLCFIAASSLAAGRFPIDHVSPTGLSVMVLGSGTPVAYGTNGRASSGYLVFTDGEPRAIIDVGGGVFKSLSMSGANIWDIKYFLLTHMHIDHQSDVPAIVKTVYFDLNQYNSANNTELTRLYNDPIQFFGPGDWAFSTDTLTNAEALLGSNIYLPPVPGSGGSEVLAYRSTTAFVSDLFDYNTGADRHLFAFVPFVTVRPPYDSTAPKSFFHVTA